MKINLLIAVIVFSLMFASCKKEDKTSAKEVCEIEFVILGKATNGNGKKLGLYIPSLGMDNRLTSEIVDDRFEFKGTLSKPERAEIAFDDELETFDGMYSVYGVFLTTDTLRIDVTIDQRDDNLYFSESLFEDNGVNTFYQKHKNEYWDAYNGLSFNPRDTVLLDSLKEDVFPQIRDSIIKVNTEVFSDKKNTIIGLYNLKNIFEDRFVFNLNEISFKQKESINNYFNDIDECYINSPDYVMVNSYIKRMNNENFGKEFMNFSLQDMSGKETQLADIIAMNDFTVLDFWWSGCAPCREFNQETKEYYKELKKNGIEIISINVDDGIKKWKVASSNDGIKWVNLYAGANSKIQVDYNVVAFPTAIIFNKNKEKIDFDFDKASELLKLK